LVSFAITARDISAQVMAEQRMRRLAAVVEAAPGAVAVVDRCGRIEECNRSAQALFGDGCRDLVGADRSVLVTDRDRAAWDEVFAAAEAGRSLTLDAVRRTAADGGDVTLRLSGFPVLADGGEVVAMAMLALDVTESERLADALRHAQTLESLGRLAGGIAHDFNNMLTVITGYVTLARRYAGDGRAVQPIDEIATAADRMQGLTRQLLAFARRESVAPTRLDLREVVAALAPMLRSLIGPAVTITLDMPEPVPRLLADRSKLEQVVVNLVANARDAMGAGGEVTISVQSPSCAAEDPAHRFVVLAVADTGEGMTPEVAKRIFEPFFSTKPAAESGAGSGTGLGLATVHGIVTSAGGEITVDSAVGRGTTFTLRFPADPTPDIAPPQEADPTRDGALGELGALGVSRASEPALASEVGPAAAPDAAHVLVCDDEAPLLALVAGALEEGGHTVHPFSDPQQALAFAADVAHRIDLIVTDVLMPGMPGPALAERVLALRPGLPVCFMSGFAPAAIDAAAWPAGCVVFDKPFDVSELVQAVHGLLEARAALG
jgi:PAS domain S-box-containing protein